MLGGERAGIKDMTDSSPNQSVSSKFQYCYIVEPIWQATELELKTNTGWAQLQECQGSERNKEHYDITLKDRPDRLKTAQTELNQP